MTFPYDDNELEKTLGEAFASPPAADFDAWRAQHAYAIACLAPGHRSVWRKRRRTMIRVAALAIAAAVLVCAWLGFTQHSPDGRGALASAQVIDQIQKAKTITWKTTFYEHITSKDGKRTWLKAETRQCAYKAPGLYREERRDGKGQLTWVEITDAVHRKQLRMNMLDKKATLSELAFATHDPQGPFAWVQKELKDVNLQWVGQRKGARGEVNVFRHSLRDAANGRDWSYDFWVDPKTRQLVELYVPGADIFDPDQDPSRNNRSEKEWSSGTIAGRAERDIVSDAPLDDALFRMTPPDGYALQTQRPPQVTEKEMVDYLGILADFNAKTFPDQVFPFAFSSDRLNAVWHKPKKDRTAAEQKLLETNDHYKRASLNLLPLGHFVENSVVDKSFRYLGKGVKLGDKDRIVCWYKLKSAKDPKTFRVVYGDLTVKDVPEADLPLPVQP